MVTDIDIFAKLLVVHGNARLVAFDLIRRKREDIALGNRDLSIFKGLDAIFGTFGIQHDRNREIELLSDLLDQIDGRLMLLVRSVGKVESRNVHTCESHFRQNILL